MAAATIKPIDTAKYECKQSNYACCPELPIGRCFVVQVDAAKVSYYKT